MKIGIIRFTPNKSNTWYYDLKDLIASILDYFSIITRSVYYCNQCGAMLVPFIGLMGPRAAGMKKVDKGYICHFCDCHSEYCSREDKYERMQFINEENKRLKDRMMFFKLLYPWAEIRYRGGLKQCSH